jgi:hypothetical protein
MRRGSFRAAEEQTGHTAETVARWLRRPAAPAAALTEALAHDLELSELEIVEFWSFVRGSSAMADRPSRRGVPHWGQGASAGSA